jgi:hypothetical protein
MKVELIDMSMRSADKCAPDEDEDEDGEEEEEEGGGEETLVRRGSWGWECGLLLLSLLSSSRDGRVTAKMVRPPRASNEGVNSPSLPACETKRGEATLRETELDLAFVRPVSRLPLLALSATTLRPPFPLVGSATLGVVEVLGVYLAGLLPIFETSTPAPATAAAAGATADKVPGC